MENRCQRCAEILGISGELLNMDADTFRKFTDGVMKAERLFGIVIM